MKKFLYVVIVPIVFWIGCSTTPSNNASKPEIAWIFDNNNLEKANLAKNQIVYRDNSAGLPKGVKSDLFGRISWFNSLLETFDLHEILTFEEKEMLFNALFGFIPEEPTDDIFRAIAIGEYFSDKSPLILYARVYKPSNKAPSGSKGILDFTGNFAAFRDKKTGDISFIPLKEKIIPNINWSSKGVIFGDGSVVMESCLFSQEYEEKTKNEAGDNIHLQYVNLADIYIKDEIKNNDEKALQMLNDAYAKATDINIRIAAKLNTFLFYLYKQDVKSAEEALAIAAQLAKRMGNINPSFMKVINIEAPTMLKIYRNNM